MRESDLTESDGRFNLSSGGAEGGHPKGEMELFVDAGRNCPTSLDARTKKSDYRGVRRDAFLRDLKRYCRKNGIAFSWEVRRGKGGHGIVTVGEKWTTVQTDLTEGRIERILKQLGLPKDAL